MTRKIIAALAAICIGVTASTALAQNQSAEDKPEPAKLKATHGDWEIRCDAKNENACLMTQIGKRGDGQSVMRVSLRKTDGAKGPNGEAIAAIMQIDAPLGVLLTAGVAVNIDGREVGRGAFQVCDTRACIASSPVAADFVNQLKKGSNAQMTIVGVSGEKADVRISLSGFTAAYNAL